MHDTHIERSPSGSSARRCALVLPHAIGDSLMMMTLALNIFLNGVDVVVYGALAEQLEAWYPWCTVQADGANATGRSTEINCDFVVELRLSKHGNSPISAAQKIEIAGLEAFRNSKQHMLDRIVDAGLSRLGMTKLTRAAGLVTPEYDLGAEGRLHVVIHPTASHPEKSWSQSKFASLALALRERGLSPCFIVPPDQRGTWEEIEASTRCPVLTLPNIAAVASLLAGAGWFIGNDSGPGHLASALGVPTLSLFMRAGLANSWRPIWSRGRVVLPLNFLPGARLRERHWQRLMSVGKVLRAFESLQQDVGNAGLA